MKTAIFIAALWAGGAQAQQVLTGPEFDEISRGTTMYFSENGLFYGAEQFLPNNRSVWRAEDGTCVNGKWAEVDGSICFVYDNGDGLHCWEIAASEQGMTVTSTTGPKDAPALVLDLTGQDNKPILCTGPKFGV